MRPGLSLVELLVVVLIIASIAGVVIPSYQRIVVKARAAEALSQIHAVRLAAYAYNNDTNGWPPDYAPGERPVELEPYLGPGYPFGGDGYLLDWENWVLADGTPKHPETGVLLGISMTTTNAALGQALVDLLGESTAHYTLGYNYTFVLAAI